MSFEDLQAQELSHTLETIERDLRAIRWGLVVTNAALFGILGILIATV